LAGVNAAVIFCDYCSAMRNSMLTVIENNALGIFLVKFVLVFVGLVSNWAG
jgi:hypothetical protein